MASTCIYCGKFKERGDLTLEHILPRRLGGDVSVDLLRSRRVCQPCNSRVGLFVDGAFLKNWFTTNFNARAALRYVDLERGSALPLVYLGELHGDPLGTGEAIDCWLGPTGDRIYHVHPPHEEGFRTYAGGDPIRAKREPGVALLWSRTTNASWLRVSLLSFANHFARARRILVNVGLRSDAERAHFGGPPEDRDAATVGRLQALDGREHRLRFSVQLGFEQRFLAKLALGIGHNLMGEPFLASPYCGLLRRALWERDPSRRQALRIPWRSSWSTEDERDALEQTLGWPDAITVLLLPASPCLVLGLRVFDRAPLLIALSDDPSMWATSCVVDRVGREGSAYVLIPQRRYVSPAVPLLSYLAELHHGRGAPALRPARAWRVDPDALPPFENPAVA